MVFLMSATRAVFAKICGKLLFVISYEKLSFLTEKMIIVLARYKQHRNNGIKTVGKRLIASVNLQKLMYLFYNLHSKLLILFLAKIL